MTKSDDFGRAPRQKNIILEPHFPQILAAMQKELAASGLSPEEILAKTLLLQVTFLLLL